MGALKVCSEFTVTATSLNIKTDVHWAFSQERFKLGGSKMSVWKGIVHRGEGAPQPPARLPVLTIVHVKAFHRDLLK